MDKRVRTGCLTCRKRRVKCDERKPVCSRCQAANFFCEGYHLPRRASNSTVSTSPHSPRPPATREDSPVSGLSLRQSQWRREQLPLYHHFVTTTVLRLFRNDHVCFWRDQVAQMSYDMDFVYEALLALGAVHRASLLACQDRFSLEAARFRVIGLQAYGNTLRLLPNHLGPNSMAELSAVLAVLMILTYFECLMEHPNAAFRHLWAAIQLLRTSEKSLSDTEVSNMVPAHDAMLRLDFLAQKFVPYAASSFSSCSSLAMMESPFWNRASPEYSGMSKLDRVAAERYRLIQLICAHNKLSRVVWGCWVPARERPSREELMGFNSELLLWKANSPATFASCDGLDSLKASVSTPVDSRPIPPSACHFASSETALNIAIYYNYLGCSAAMISYTDQDPAERELEIFDMVYQTMCIAAGLIEKHNDQYSSLYKPCDAISAGISMFLYHAARRLFSLEWKKWIINALRSIGREGISNGFTSANTLDIMCQLEATVQNDNKDQLRVDRFESYLGPIRDRIIPLLMPRGEDDQFLAFYLRGYQEDVQVVAKATWKQDFAGTMTSLKLDVYDSAFVGFPFLSERPKVLDLFVSWRQAVEKGWHGYLGTKIQEGFLQS